MKLLKVYGGSKHPTIYINNVKVDANEFLANNDNAYMTMKSGFGYGCTDYVFIIEDESEKQYVDVCGVVKEFAETRMPYYLYKQLDKLTGAGFMRTHDYDAATKTIAVSCQK